jgi:hypothetical protein
MTDSSNTTEEAVQNPEHRHGEWAISGSNLGSQQWRHFDCHSHKQSSLQCHHSLLIACMIQLLNMISIYTYVSFTKLANSMHGTVRMHGCSYLHGYI